MRLRMMAAVVVLCGVVAMGFPSEALALVPGPDDCAGVWRSGLESAVENFVIDPAMPDMVIPVLQNGPDVAPVLVESSPLSRAEDALTKAQAEVDRLQNLSALARAIKAALMCGGVQ